MLRFSSEVISLIEGFKRWDLHCIVLRFWDLIFGFSSDGGDSYSPWLSYHDSLAEIYIGNRWNLSTIIVVVINIRHKFLLAAWIRLTFTFLAPYKSIPEFTNWGFLWLNRRVKQLRVFFEVNLHNVIILCLSYAIIYVDLAIYTLEIQKLMFPIRGQFRL